MKHIRIFACILSVIILCSLAISAIAENTYVYEYSEQNTTVAFSESSLLTDYSRQSIADVIVYNLPLSQTYSMCWLLGHDTITETVTATYHERSPYDPRCQLEIYHVTSCVNCDYVKPELMSSQYISCCPPDASAVSLD